MHAKISISILTPWYRIQIVLLPDITFLSWLSKLINPILQQYQYDRNYGKFNCCLEIQSKLTAIISICTLNPLKLPSNQSHIWRQPSTPLLPISILQKERQIHLLLGKSLKKGWNNLYLLPKFFQRSSKPNSYLMLISHSGPVNLSTPTFGNISLTEAMANLLVVWKFNLSDNTEW